MAQTKVDDGDFHIAVDHHIFELQVAVEDAMLVRVGDSLVELDEDILNEVFGKCVGLHKVKKVVSSHKVHNDVVTFVVFQVLVDTSNVGVVQNLACLHLVQYSLAFISVVSFADSLECVVFAVFGVEYKTDCPVGATAELLHKLEFRHDDGC